MLKAPYNFVPLNKDIYVPSWWNQVSHDIPFSDCEDGYIEVGFSNLSPLFCRDGHSRNNQSDYSAHIKDKDGNKIYFIPATSIKGMLRSTLEVLSFAKMSQYCDRYYGYRDFDTDKTGGKQYIESMKQVKGGWLEKRGNQYILHPCAEDFIPVRIDQVKKEFNNYSDKKSSWKNNYALGMYPIVRNDSKIWHLVCTGSMINQKNPDMSKKHEYLFSEDTIDEIILTNEEKKKFLTVNEPTPEFENYLKHLNKGQRIAVFYLMDNNDNIEAIGLSKMIRYPYKKNVTSIIEGHQKRIKERDLCETIWGCTEDDYSLRGRVQITHAFTKSSIPDSSLIERKGVLGGPKASYYPLYLEQTKDKYKTYDNATTISGRKRYRIHSKGCQFKLQEGNGNKKVETSLKALPSNQTFFFRINLHNMRKIEIGAILSALTFHATQEAHHNIGMAKSQGFGKLSHPQIKLNGLNYEIDEYLKSFEDEMEKWYVRKSNNRHWNESIQVTTLIAIAKEHNEDELGFMSLKEYGNNKRNQNFDTLSESITPIKKIVVDQRKAIEKEREIKRKQMISELRNLIEDKRIKDAELWLEEHSDISEEDLIKPIILDAKKAISEVKQIIEEAEELKAENKLQEAIEKYIFAEERGYLEYGPIRQACQTELSQNKKSFGPIEDFLKDIIKLASIPAFAGRLKKRKEKVDITEDDIIKIADFIKEKLNENKKLSKTWKNDKWDKIEEVITKELSDKLYALIFG